jgi:hypothetical protein
MINFASERFFGLVCHGPEGAGGEYILRQKGGSLNRGHPHRPRNFFLLPHYRLFLQLLQNSEDFSVLRKLRQVMTKHCFVIESDTGFENYATKTNMHITRGADVSLAL